MKWHLLIPFENEILQMYRDGATRSAIGRTYGVSAYVVGSFLRQSHVSIPKYGMQLSIEDRFWQKVSISDGCWEWGGAIHGNGYGILSVHGKMQLAHRVSWQLRHGNIEDGLCVCHHCDNPKCVRPDHLFLGTQADNVHDMIVKGRNFVPAGESHGNAVLTEDQVREIKMASGTCAEIAVKYGIDNASVGKIKAGKLWRCVVGPYTKSAGKRKLTDEQEDEIVSSVGFTQCQLAAKYGVDQTTISNIKRRGYRIPR